MPDTAQPASSGAGTPATTQGKPAIDALVRLIAGVNSSGKVVARGAKPPTIGELVRTILPGAH